MTIYKRINLTLLISLVLFLTFAQKNEESYQYTSSALNPRLGSDWKLIKEKKTKEIIVKGYIPKDEKPTLYSKIVAIGTIKKVPHLSEKQLYLFNSHKKNYLYQHECKIQEINPKNFSNFRAKSLKGFIYECQKLFISGFDITLSADDPTNIYNVIYEFRSENMSPEEKKEALDSLKKMEICYDNNPDCLNQKK